MRFSSLALVLLLVPPCVAAPSTEPADPKPSQVVLDAVRDLDSPQYKVRAAALRQLLDAGTEAIAPLVEAAATGSPEVVDSALKVLQELMFNREDKTATAAREALKKLARGKGPTRTQARAILRQFQDRVKDRLLAAGATFEPNGDQLRAITLDTVQDLAAVLPLLREFPELEEVSLSNKKFDDAGMRHLLPLKELRSLNLYRSSIGDEALKLFKEFPKLEWVPMGETKVTDAGLVHIAELTQLEYVGLRGNNVTDAGLVHLKKLTNLTGLYLGETKVTDAGLDHLQGMTQMQSLRLHDIPITDAGLEKLHGMKHLRYVYLDKTKVTAQGIERLKEAIPGVQTISRN